jgi:ArsR family transcriptional regulator, arsenate/arsenite/antimonite-responsive transcriptional repressor
MKDIPEKSSKEELPLDMRRWQPQDISANEIRTEQDPQFFTPHLARLRVLGLALSDPKRLLILALLAEEDRPLFGQEIAERLAVTPQTISHHLQILRNGGLVREERRENAYRYYILDTASIRRIRETFFEDDHLGLLTKGEARQQVVETFFEGERLVSIPVQRSKRRIILEELARKLEWGRIYTESEVNALLKQSFDDVSSLRRYLIDEQIMMREHGRYWLIHPHDENIC